MATKTSKEQLIEELEKLPEVRLREVLDFVGYLRTKEGNGDTEKLPEDLDPKKDPILRLMGIADVEPFSKDIDEELYEAQR